VLSVCIRSCPLFLSFATNFFKFIFCGEMATCQVEVCYLCLLIMLCG
jgi:hypothetical protein